jgi:hypothetical protein
MSFAGIVARVFLAGELMDGDEVIATATVSAIVGRRIDASTRVCAEAGKCA